MIPKIIHYCWFGHNPKPELAAKCIDSWKKFCPDYEIKEWNEDNFDISTSPLYVRQAYEAKKWAFVSDYARFWILYHFGGVYFDTDVEVIRDITPIVDKGAFMGCESDGIMKQTSAITPGLGIAVAPGLGIYKELLDLYETLSFYNEDDTLNCKTIVEYTTETLIKHGLKDSSEIQNIEGVLIYPKEYFCPKDYVTGKINCTENTYTIHHFDGSWKSEQEKKEIKEYFHNLPRQKRKAWLVKFLKGALGEENYSKIRRYF